MKATSSLPHQHGEALPSLLSSMPSESAFVTSSGIFTQLSDPTRLKILWILCHSEECVTNIAAAIGMSDPAVSHHLRILRSSALVTSHRIGKEVHYTLSSTADAQLVHSLIDDIFDIHCTPTEKE